MNNLLDVLHNNPELIDLDFLKNLTYEELELIENESNNLSKKYTNIELSKKKQINTLYGALANSYFPLYDIRLADSTTSFGRLYIKSIGNRVNNYLISNYDYNNENSLIYTHTDSAYFTLKPIVDNLINEYTNNNKDFVDLLFDKSKDIMKIIEAQFQYCSKICNSKNNSVLKMELESISDKGIWASSSNYFIRNYYKKQRLINSKIKIVGMEIIKSSTSKFSKEIFKNNLELFLDKSNFDILNFINEQYSIFEKEKIDNISFNKKINNLNKYIVDDFEKLQIIDEILSIKKKLFNIKELNYDEEIIASSYNKKIIYDILNDMDYHISLNKIDLDYIHNSLINIEKNIDVKYNYSYNQFKINLIKKIHNYYKKINDEFFYNDNENEFYIKKGTNNYIVASIKFNQYIKDNKLDNQFNEIYSGDKVKLLYLKKNNPFDTDIIAFKDLKFIKYLKNWIDYKVQFEKSFINPLSQITNVLNIDTSFKNREFIRNKDEEYYDIFN